MKYGFVKTAAVSPKIRVADTEYNAQETIRLMREAWEKGARIIVFPELVHYRLHLFRPVPPGYSAGRSAKSVAGDRSGTVKAWTVFSLQGFHWK